MSPQSILFLLIICVFPTLAAGQDSAPLPLNEARELGRKKSQFLKQTAKVAPDAGQAIPEADIAQFQKSIESVLQKSCLACHGPEKSKGGLRVDELDPDLLNGPDVEHWREVYNVLSNSEMPPEDEPDYALSDSDRSNIVDWLSAEMDKASIVQRNSAEHSSFRRMAKYEYNYALQDLLGLPLFSFADRLPPETASGDGFKNSSEMLQISAIQFQTYREIALAALKRATVGGERPDPVTYVITMQDEMEKAAAHPKAKKFDRANEEDYKNHSRRVHLINQETGEAIVYANPKAQPIADAVAGQNPESSAVSLVLPRNNELKLGVDRFLPDDGIMRVRARVGRTNLETPGIVSLQLWFSAHTSNNANFSNIVSQRDVPVTASAEKPEFIHFDIPLGDIQRNPFRKLETTFPRRDEFVHLRHVTPTGGINVHIDYVEVTAPFYEEWPPKSHTDIFFDSVATDDEGEYGRAVITRFAERAWRRPVATEEVDRLMELFARYRPEFDSFEEAMLEVLATILAAPEFLYLTQRETADDTKMSDLELASRLSFFLWSSIPDQQLLELARGGKLKDPKILSGQIERMLADQRSGRMLEHFVQQWLGLDGLNGAAHVTDKELAAAMAEEPIAFFEEVLKSNSSVMDFIHSDYVVVNERLARHYGVRDVIGPDFRKVAVDRQRQRGGILTGAGILAMNAEGTDSNPLKRGVWMLERVLHDPPPPPPPDVPEVDLTDPKILEMTLKERIEDHRNDAACMSCHSRIDPWGIAFENYDALGAYRTKIGSVPVDATSRLFDKQPLEGMEGLKRYLLVDRQDQFARAMVHKMTAYGLGRPLTFGDHSELEDITAKFRQSGDGLRDLIHVIIGSELFQSR